MIKIMLVTIITLSLAGASVLAYYDNTAQSSAVPQSTGIPFAEAATPPIRLS